MILASCLLFVAAATPALEPRAQEAIDTDAVDAYRAGDHSDALARWDELLGETSLEPAERGRLLYNAGNAAARGGSWAVAVGYYTEALRVTPRDGDLWANLEYARREAGMAPADRGDLVSTLGRGLSAWTLEEARWIALGGLLLFAAALIYEALRGGRAGRSMAWAGLALALLSAAPLARHQLADDSPTVFVVSRNGLAVRSEPRADAQVLERATSCTYLVELDRLSGWVGVDMDGGAKGWVPEEGVLTLPTLLLESAAE